MNEHSYIQALNTPLAIRTQNTARTQRDTQQNQHYRDTKYAGVNTSDRLRHFLGPFLVAVVVVAAALTIDPNAAIICCATFVIYLKWIWISNSRWLYCRAIAQEIPFAAELISSELEVAPTARIAITECFAQCPHQNDARRVLFRILLKEEGPAVGRISPLHVSALIALLETLPVSDRNGAARLRSWADVVRTANHRNGQRERQIEGAIRTLYAIPIALAVAAVWWGEGLSRNTLHGLGHWGSAVDISLFAAGCIAFITGHFIGLLWRREVWRD